MATRSHPSWFLLESDGEKVFRAICNYLSLGQFELARSLLRINFEQEVEIDSSCSPMGTNVSKLLRAIVESGPPDSWICSRSVPSTAHLLCMCKDFLRDLNIPVVSEIDRRCEFDLMLAMALIESKTNKFASEVATELRIRYSSSLLTESQKDSLILPRLLVSSESQILVLAGVVLPGDRRHRDSEPQLSSDVTDFLLKLCLASRQTGNGLIELLHAVSSLVSAQLTHIQAALVANSAMEGDWESVCRNLRYLNEWAATSELLGSSPLLNDLCSLLVFLSHSRDGLAVMAQKKELGHQVSKFISDCISPTHGSYPFVVKKRRACFSLASMLEEQYFPNEKLRLGLYECLSARMQSDSACCLLEVVAKLEDTYLALHCDRRTLPPCFDSDHPVPFWDAYSDFVRMARVNCLRYPLETAVNLVRRREFDLAEKLLVNFNQLRPALILLCWDDFGVDIQSRASLLRVAWHTFLEAGGERQCMQAEEAVWGIARRFEAALALAAHFSNKSRVKKIQNAWLPVDGQAESVIDIMRQLPVHSLLFVMRAVLVSQQLASVVPWMTSLPAAGRESLEASFDLDVARAYFALRSVLSLVVVDEQKEFSTLLSDVDRMCSTIERDSIKHTLLEKIVNLCFAPANLLRSNTNNNHYTVKIKILFSLVCLVCCHSQELRGSAQQLLVTILVCLKESARYLPCMPRRMKGVCDWAKLLGADPELADRIAMSGIDIPKVEFSKKKSQAFLTPPRCSMALSAEMFVPRLRGAQLHLVQSALAMNDYALARNLAEFFNIDSADGAIVEAESFQTARDALRMGQYSLSVEDPVMLIDLAVSGNPPSEVSLSMLNTAQSTEICSPALVQWASKLAVLLEAKTELSGKMNLAEVVLGIETLPNEPELLKDHLSRMHTQRSAIMALVDRVDQVRRGQANEEPDFLTEAIRKLNREGMESVTGDVHAFLIKFLEYLSKVCSLVQQAGPTGVSLFDVLSEEPVDLVARIVFQHKGFKQAFSLCELMHMDLIAIVQAQSVSIVGRSGQDDRRFYISLDLVSELSKLDAAKAVSLCLERRTRLWPSSQLLQYALDEAEKLKLSQLRNWIEERKKCWSKFLSAYTESDASGGFSLEEENNLPPQVKLALLSVATGSQESMDALCKLAAHTHMQAGDFIAALEELDSNLSKKDSNKDLIDTALMGCLELSHAQLCPEEIYELLWRVRDCETLLRLSVAFYKAWPSEVAVKALELCAERLGSSKNSDELETVLHLVRVIRTMAAVAAAIPLKNFDWQTLEALSSSEECEGVISDLIEVSEHSLAVEFLDLKSAFVNPDQLDVQSDTIELSRLRHIFLSLTKAKLLVRLQSCHHPVKASRLGLQLMDSIRNIADRTRLGYLLLENGIACEEDQETLTTQLATLGLFALTDSAEIRVPDWTSGLMERPDLVLESLLMNGHTRGLEIFFKKFPSCRNDPLLIAFAAKALTLTELSGTPDQTVPCSEDRGFGGIWSLTAVECRDSETRKRHRFNKAPDMRLALSLLNLLSDVNRNNAIETFKFADQLSLFLNESERCPFPHFSYLRQAIIALIRFVQDRFAQCLPADVAVACEHGIENIKLLIDLWQTAKIKVGLAALSDFSTQEKIRDQLIDQDHLDLAELVCYATGHTPRSELAADVVTIKRATLLVQAGDTPAAMTVLGEKLNQKQLSSAQLLELEQAVRTRPNVTLAHLKQVHEILLCASLSSSCPPSLIIPRNLPYQVCQLLPCKFFDPLLVTPFTTGSHMRGESSLSCCAESSDEIENESRDVCLSTPRLVFTDEKGETIQEEENVFDDILVFYERFGQPCSVLSFLIREGKLGQAVHLAVKQRTVSEKLFVQAVIDSGSCCWIPLVQALRSSKEPCSSFLAEVELYLRSSGNFRPLYDCEVAMGREAAAGIVAIHLYLRAESWEERLGWLESALRHLDSALTYKSSKRLLQKRRRRKLAKEGDMVLSSSDEEEEDKFVVRRTIDRISVPFRLPFSAKKEEVTTESTILAVRALADLQLQVTRLVPQAPVSASLFGSIQSVSEAIDFLLMEGQVGTARIVVNRLKLPDSALCGIFDL